MKLIMILWTILFSISLLNAQEKIYQTNRINNPLKIDAVFDEPAWDLVTKGNNFVQRNPIENHAPAFRTSFKIVYSENDLYIGVICQDIQPDKIVRRLGRHDSFEGDYIEILLDTDGLGEAAYSFSVTSAGVKGDEYVTLNGRKWDPSWNPVWDAVALITNDGWQVEMRIPFHQINWNNEADQIGLQVVRKNFRLGETSMWQFIPRSQQDYLSGFGKLNGIKSTSRKLIHDYTPYFMITGLKHQGFQTKPKVGFDGRLKFAKAGSLQFSIHPDFGQVEADPAELVIDGYQLFQKERRPLFTEQKDRLEMPITESLAKGSFSQDQLFYSRRIGKSPTLSNQSEDPFLETDIAGALKYVNTSSSGAQYAFLQAFSLAEQKGSAMQGDTLARLELEPATHFTVGKVSIPLSAQSTLEWQMTSTQRTLQSKLIKDLLVKSALTSGIHFTHKWKKGAWRFSGNMVFSHLVGSTHSIIRKQHSFEHYFQRPGTNHLKVDSIATNFSGTGAHIKLSRYHKSKNLYWETGITHRSPKLDLNDAGYMYSADEIFHYAWLRKQINKPIKSLRWLYWNATHWLAWDFSGQLNYQAIQWNLQSQFKNFWGINLGLSYKGLSISTKALRGGPALKQTGGWTPRIVLYTDRRKKLGVELKYFTFIPAVRSDQGYKYAQVQGQLTYRPVNSVLINSSIFFKQETNQQQWVYTALATGTYLLATMDRKTFSWSQRFEFIFSPKMSIQYWGQLYHSKGIYSHYKKLQDPMNNQLSSRTIGVGVRSDDFSSNLMIADDDTATTFRDRSFNYFQFRSNFVLRWEYRPGSQFFFIWAIKHRKYDAIDKSRLDTIKSNLFERGIPSRFTIKASCRIIR